MARGEAMNLARLRDDLHRYMHDALHRHSGANTDIDRLLHMLEKKDAKLQQQLAEEQDPLKRRHLKIELQVTRLQHKKGLAKRLEMLGS